MGGIRGIIRGGRLVFESVYGVVRRPKSSRVVELNPGPSGKADEPTVGPISAARVGRPDTDTKADRELSHHWGWPQ